MLEKKYVGLGINYLVVCNRQSFIVHSSGGQEVQEKASADLVSSEDPCLIDGSFCVSSHGRRGKKGGGVGSPRDLS